MEIRTDGIGWDVRIITESLDFFFFFEFGDTN